MGHLKTIYIFVFLTMCRACLRWNASPSIVKIAKIRRILHLQLSYYDHRLTTSLEPAEGDHSRDAGCIIYSKKHVPLLLFHLLHQPAANCETG